MSSIIKFLFSVKVIKFLFICKYFNSSFSIQHLLNHFFFWQFFWLVLKNLFYFWTRIRKQKYFGQKNCFKVNNVVNFVKNLFLELKSENSKNTKKKCIFHFSKLLVVWMFTSDWFSLPELKCSNLDCYLGEMKENSDVCFIF